MIIGRSGEDFYVAHGNQVLKVALEHLRYATSEGKQGDYLPDDIKEGLQKQRWKLTQEHVGVIDLTGSDRPALPVLLAFAIYATSRDAPPQAGCVDPASQQPGSPLKWLGALRRRGLPEMPVSIGFLARPQGIAQTQHTQPLPHSYRRWLGDK